MNQLQEYDRHFQLLFARFCELFLQQRRTNKTFEARIEISGDCDLEHGRTLFDTICELVSQVPPPLYDVRPDFLLTSITREIADRPFAEKLSLDCSLDAYPNPGSQNVNSQMASISNRCSMCCESGAKPFNCIIETRESEESPGQANEFR